jgi:vancomycin resistance protein VanW
LQIKNNSNNYYQILISFTENELKGEIRCGNKVEYDYHIHERNHKFVNLEGVYYRSNEIWRTVRKKGVNGMPKQDLYNQLMVKNFAKVKYAVKT